MFGDELGQRIAELIDAFLGVGALDTDGEGGVGGVVRWCGRVPCDLTPEASLGW
jgi:hypothetical protein